jgi:hypothetical protein
MWRFFCREPKRRRLPTRARQPWGTVIMCCKCKEPTRVWNFSWTALVCPNCDREVAKNDWEFAEAYQTLSDVNFTIQRR